MKKLLLLFALSIVSLQFFSCTTDYDGPKPGNQDPIINVYDTTDITSSKKTKIQWYGNDIDGMKLTYYYTVTTDTMLTVDNVKTSLPLNGLDSDGRNNWTSTELTYAYISMPYRPYHSETAYLDSSEYTMTGADSIPVTVSFKAVYSKLFVFGVDENGSETDMTSKLFKRTNRVPKFPMVFSSKLGLNGFDQYWMTVGPDSSQMVLEAPTAFWKAFDFKWMGEDPDGTDVDLEFRWELWERQKYGGDSVKVMTSAGWSINNLSKSFDDEIYNHNKQGKYSFKVYVRDDAFEESENCATINFEVFSPEFTKGILLVDDNDPLLYPPASSLVMGNPNTDSTKVFYDSLLRFAGFKPEGEATDSLNLYRITKFSKGTEFIGYEYFEIDDDNDPSTPDVLDSIARYRTLYTPGLKELTKYRLVILVSDDRSSTYGIDFAGTATESGYNSYLSSFLDVGGNLFIMGNSVLMGNLYVSPDQLKVNQYASPYRQVFDVYAAVVATISNGSKEFFNKYFGIYSMTFPEAKTYYTVPGTSSTQYCSDHYLADNYDFIGTTAYEHITDANFKPLRLDSAKVNDAWYNVAGTQGRIRKHELKGNGTVFTGVPSFEAYKGEVVYRYKSIYDLPRVSGNDSLSQDEGNLTHYLWCKNYVTGEIVQPVLRRSGTVATRYIADGNVFKTAFFGFPAYFMDNSENQISDMFKTMIEWFDINNEGGSK